LKLKEGEENVQEIAIDTTFKEGGRGNKFEFKCLTTKVRRQCPLVLLVKVR
jgi:hypothetical protein